MTAREQKKAAHRMQEQLYKLYCEARSHNLAVAEDIKNVAERLSAVISGRE